MTRPKSGDVAALLGRVERAEGPSLELDRAIHDTMFPPVEEVLDCGHVLPAGWGRGMMDPSYSFSLDAALALVERVKPGVWWIVGRGKLTAGEPEFCAQLLFGADEVLGQGEGPTAPLSILAALLRVILADPKATP